jgi:hypothetical protein
MANPTGTNQVLTKIYESGNNAIRVHEITGGGGGITSSTNPTIVNVSAATANTEYSYTFPASTKKFIMRSREKGIMKISYTSGGSGVTYLTVTSGSFYFEEYILFGGTIYFQTNKSSDTIEILSWA